MRSFEFVSAKNALAMIVVRRNSVLFFSSAMPFVFVDFVVAAFCFFFLLDFSTFSTSPRLGRNFEK